MDHVDRLGHHQLSNLAFSKISHPSPSRPSSSSFLLSPRVNNDHAHSSGDQPIPPLSPLMNRRPHSQQPLQITVLQHPDEMIPSVGQTLPPSSPLLNRRPHSEQPLQITVLRHPDQVIPPAPALSPSTSTSTSTPTIVPPTPVSSSAKMPSSLQTDSIPLSSSSGGEPSSSPSEPIPLSSPSERLPSSSPSGRVPSSSPSGGMPSSSLSTPPLRARPSSTSSISPLSAPLTSLSPHSPPSPITAKTRRVRRTPKLNNDNENHNQTKNKNPRLHPDSTTQHVSQASLNNNSDNSNHQPVDPSFSNFSYRNTSFFLDTARTTGRLGSGQPESSAVDGNLVMTVIRTIPWSLLALQLLWSIIITAIAFGIGRNSKFSVFSEYYWISRLNVPISVTYSLGWALFVLLGFFLHEASNRYLKGQFALHSVGTYLRQVVRVLRQLYPPNTWHEGDLDRVVAHIVAYPIALKMTLRNEREAAQLDCILHPNDLEDVIHSDLMHIHCSRVVRAYFSISDHDPLSNSFSAGSSKSIAFTAAKASNFFVIDILDAVDMAANSALQIAEFRSAFAYVNHLRILLAIWLIFLPLSLLRSCGWYTILWSVILSYCVVMFYVTANALNEPYGYEMQDIKLNKLCAEYSYDCLMDYAGAKLRLSQLIVSERDTPTWLEDPWPEEEETPHREEPHHFSIAKIGTLLSQVRVQPMKPIAAIAVLFFTIWCFGVVFITWGFRTGKGQFAQNVVGDQPRMNSLPTDDFDSGVRWWRFYVPIDTITMSYISLAVFLLLSFWINDAYSRFWRSLYTWLTRVRPRIEQVVFQVSLSCERGIWHPRDRERIMSHLAALPYAAKLSLRDSRDLEELEGILAPGDIQAMIEAPRIDLHVLNVIYAYIISADSQNSDTFSSSSSPFPATVYNVLYSLWDVEKAITECHGIRKFPLSPAFTAHMKVFTVIWLAILPISIVELNGYLTIVFAIPIGYSIINLIMAGRIMSDPFGWDADDIPLDDICQDMKHTVHKIYHDTMGGPQSYVHHSHYDRASFKPDVSASVEYSQLTDESHDEDETGSKFDVDVEGNIDLNDDRPTSDRPISNQTGDHTTRKTNRKRLLSPFKALFRMIKSSILRFVKIAKTLVTLAKANPQMLATQQYITPTLEGSILKFFRSLPTVSTRVLLAIIVWTFIAVFISWGTSKVWDENLRHKLCPRWCSPVDVDPVMLANIGFALILILAFQARDAINRYDDGAVLIYDMEMHLRVLATEIVQSFRNGLFHPGDKERIIAHLVQVPLCFRDALLGIERFEPEEKEGLLSDEDRERFENSFSPMEHLLQTVEAYFLTQDSASSGEVTENVVKNPRTITYTVVNRLSSLREMISSALSVKQFPVVHIFQKNQHVFLGIWLALLPFSMTATSGFVTLVWAPIISYGVLALEAIAAQLVDPFGTDAVDLPVDKLCTGAANAVLEAVNSTEWECDYHTQPSHCDTDPHLGCSIQGRNVYSAFTLARIEHRPEIDQFAIGVNLKFSGPREAKTNPSFYAHLLRSAPWWVLLAVGSWTSFACVLSYVGRVHSDSPYVRWWESGITVSESVALYLAFAAFTLLTFYVTATLNRYNTASRLVGNDLRARCHSLTALFLSLAPRGFIHPNDHERIIGHIAAIPLVLKADLRQSRDIRDVKGLLSYTDLARLQCAGSMITHCVDVIRSYLFKVLRQEAEIQKRGFSKPKNRSAFVIEQIKSLEQLIRSAKFVRTFSIAPGFLLLLKALLTIFFAIVPFALAETSGWFTILWILIVAYGVLGMYSIASELENPFGNEFNDLDLDGIADSIVLDILFVHRHQKDGWGIHIKAIQPPVDWLQPREGANGDPKQQLFAAHDRLKFKDRLKESFSFAKEVVSKWSLISLLIWTLVCIGAANLVSSHFPFANENKSCNPWFCSAIAIPDYLKEYFGFALFLLLGYRLHDSHFRYITALRIWQDDLIGTARVFTNRLCEAYAPGTWHEGDIERICGHVAAFAVCLMGTLRKDDCVDELREVVGEEDVQRMLRARRRTDHCIDVLRAYLIESENVGQNNNRGGIGRVCGSNEHWVLLRYVGKLSSLAAECEGMVRMPQPYGYVKHLKVFTFLWIITLPLGLVEGSGWLTLLWIGLIVYGVTGIETWAMQLSDPFGTDVADIPLKRLVNRVIDVVRVNLNLFRSGAESVICTDRDGFPVDPEAHLIGKSEEV